MGSLFISGLYTSILAVSFTSATSPADLEKVVDLKGQVQKLTQELHQQTQQSDVRYNEFLVCVGATDSLELQVREDLERLERLRGQMVVYNEQMRAGSSDDATRALTSSPSPPLQQETTTTTMITGIRMV